MDKNRWHDTDPRVPVLKNNPENNHSLKTSNHN